MFALSIRQPWADLILLHRKDIENRTWRLPSSMIGQRICVHAGKKYDEDAYWPATLPDVPPDPDRLGAILGEITIVDCVTTHPSLWFYGPYGFVLEDPEPYRVPIPCRGSLGFFRWQAWT